MIEPLSLAADDAPTLWWEALAEGTNVPVALVRIERLHAVRSDGDAVAADAALREQARLTAGVEYIARAFGAAQPLTWMGEGTTLFLGGVAAERLPARAYLVAKELWERARIDLDLPVRIGAHVGHIQRGADPETFASDDVDLCEHLAAAAPSGAIVLSEDVVLALREPERRDLASLGVTLRDGEPTWVFPAGAALQRDLTAFADSSDQVLWDAFRRYALGTDVRMLRYVGFRLQKNEPPSLDIRDVFVSPQVELQTRREARSEGGTPGRLHGSAAVHHVANRDTQDPAGPIEIRDFFARHRSAVVLGDPGSGKTTLVRWLAVAAASGRFLLGAQLGVHERLLPLPVSVGLLAEVRRSFPNGVAEVPAVLARYFHDRGIGDERAIEAFLVHTLDMGRGLVLLDGLDEVRAEERSSTHAWLESFAAKYPKSRFVATSRVVGFTGFSMPKAAQITLKPFDDAQVDQYVYAFSKAYARWELGGDDAGRGEADAERLLGSLRDNGRLIAIATNPFMLSALALVHRAEGRLPRHRVQAYELFARALCETWADARRLVAQGPVGVTIAYEEEALPILGELAIAMHRRYPTGVAPKAFVIEVLSKALEERRDVSGEEAERAAIAFLERAGREVQILIERGAGEWGFLHLTFQEFFAAAGLHALERFEDEAFAHLFDPRWEEVLRLGVGYLALVQKRPEAARRFVQKVLEYEAPEPERWVTSVLKKQVPLAALLAAEAGDALPVSMQRRVAEALAAWVCDPPFDEKARECLEELRQTDFAAQVEESLIGWLKVEEPEKRRQAVRRLGEIHASNAAEDLIEMLSDVNRDVRDAAVNILVQLEDDSFLPLLESALYHNDGKTRASAAEVLLRVSGVPLESLTRFLQDPDECVRVAALEVCYDFDLAQNGEIELVTETLLRAVQDESAEVRCHATFFLGRVAEISRGVDAFLLHLARDDSDVNVRLMAASELDRVPSEEAVYAMFAVLVDLDVSDGLSKDSVAQGLSQNPLRELVERRTFELLDSNDERSRIAAVMVLAHLRSDKADDALVVRTKDSSPRVREHVLEALTWFGHRFVWCAVEALCDSDVSVRLMALMLLRLCASELDAIPDELFAMLRSDEAEEVRSKAIAAMGRFEDSRCLPVMIQALGDPSAAVRRDAAHNLGKSKAVIALTPLLESINDESWEVRRESALALGTLHFLTAIPCLLRALPNTPAAREALWKLAERLHQPNLPTNT